jgi:hypothetical protein
MVASDTFLSRPQVWQKHISLGTRMNSVKNNECDVTSWNTMSFQMRHSQGVTFPIAPSKRWKSSCLSIKLSMFTPEFRFQNHSIVFIHFDCVYYLRLKPWILMKRFRYFHHRSKVCFSKWLEINVGVTFNVAVIAELWMSAAYRISSSVSSLLIASLL